MYTPRHERGRSLYIGIGNVKVTAKRKRKGILALHLHVKGHTVEYMTYLRRGLKGARAPIAMSMSGLNSAILAALARMRLWTSL